MLGSIKRFFSGTAAGPDLKPAADWAQRRGHEFRRARDGGGFVIEGLLEDKPWRLEWGPPQRDYIEGRELRLRMELRLPSEMQMLLLSKPLMDALERRTYEEFVESTQTQIGTTTPEEMRWLVMFPKLNLATIKTLKPHFGAVASQPLAGMAWIEGSLAAMLAQAHDSLLANDPPFVLMTLRSRAYLRMELARPDPAAIGMALDVFETAVTQALRIAGIHGGSNGGDWASTASSAWQSLRPDEMPGRQRN